MAIKLYYERQNIGKMKLKAYMLYFKDIAGMLYFKNIINIRIPCLVV
jgi:hypothetical protein